MHEDQFFVIDSTLKETLKPRCLCDERGRGRRLEWGRK